MTPTKIRVKESSRGTSRCKVPRLSPHGRGYCSPLTSTLSLLGLLQNQKQQSSEFQFISFLGLFPTYEDKRHMSAAHQNDLSADTSRKGWVTERHDSWPPTRQIPQVSILKDVQGTPGALQGQWVMTMQNRRQPAPAASH